MKSFIWLCIIFIYFINYINCENITITVGERGLNFSPQNVTAKYNDAIKWVFLNGRHQVVQSDGPAGSCIKSSDINAFESILQEGGEFNYIITQTSGTLYYFCSFSSHCAYGMWGTIYIDSNPEPTIQSSPSPYVPPPPPPDNSENLPIIIGSSIGGFFALAISGLIIFMLYRRNKYQKQFEVAMQPYDPKLNAGGGNDRVNNLSDGNIGIPATSASSINLSRTNTNIYDDHSNNEVIASNISPNMTPSIVSNIVPNTQLNDETIRSYEERASNEYGVYRGTSKRDSLYHYNTSDGERSERSTISPPPTYPIQNPYNYNPNDEKYYLQQQQPQQPQQLPQQPPIPPRPTNIPPSQQQFGAPYLPPRPLAVNRFPPQYGPSSSPPPQEYQYNISSDPFGPANPGNYQQRQLRQSNLPRPPPPPPSQPPPSQPLPPPPTQQQTNQYIIDSAQYYNPNNSDI